MGLTAGFWACVLAAFFTCWGSWDYLIEVFQRDTDPRLASWALWTCSAGIAAIGAARTRPRFWPSVTLAGVDAATCAVLLAAGIAWGNREAGWLDAAGLAVGGTGVALLIIALVRPAAVPMTAALAASVVTDLAALAAVVANGWRGEESPGSFLKMAAGGAVVLVMAAMAPAYRQANGLIFPLYLTVAALAMSVIAAAGRRRVRIPGPVTDWRVRSEPLPPGPVESATVARWRPPRRPGPPPGPWTYPSGPLI